jgi:hypothetical protein
MITHTSPSELIARAKNKDNIDVDVYVIDRCDGVRMMECHVSFNAEEYPANIDKLLGNMRSAVMDSVTSLKERTRYRPTDSSL